MENTRLRQSRELTSEQLARAQALANINVFNYQRPDEDLVKRMRKKNSGFSNQAVQYSAPSTLLTSAISLSSQLGQSVSNLPIPQLGSSNVSSIIPGPWHSAQSLSECDDWEDHAKKDITRKGLSLDRAWDRRTWKQKASNLQRLKLLKDDGYDIAPLLGKKGKRVSADAIITALLDHAKTRKVNNADPASAAVAQTTQSLASAAIEKLSEPAQGSIRGGHAIPTTANRKIEILDEKFKMAAPLAGIKRKHSHVDEYQPAWSELSPQKALHDSYNKAKANCVIERPCTCCRYDKVMRVMTREEVSKAFEEQAFDIVKRRIGRDTFRYSRAARRIRHFQASASVSQYVVPSKPSRIVFQPLASSAHLPPELHACISANGTRLIMEELKHIAYGCNENSNMFFKDPEEAEDQEGDRLMLVRETGDEHFRYHIRLYTTPEFPMIIEGETLALAGLMKRLHENELTHRHSWQYDVDRMEVIAIDSPPWFLGDATRSILKDLEKLLEAEQTLGGVEARLGCLDSPQKVSSV